MHMQPESSYPTGFANYELTKMCLPVHLCSSESLPTNAKVQIPVREATYHLIAVESCAQIKIASLCML